MIALASSGVMAVSPDSIISVSLNNSGVIKVIQPAELENHLYIKAADPTIGDENADDDGVMSQNALTRKVGGYRVQVFSDNNPRTAKNEARAKAREISQAFQHLRTYVVFTAPYWRLRVGDFKSAEEAESVASQIKKHFPAYSREIRVVRDRINTVK